MRSFTLLALVAVVVLTGCAWQTNLLNNKQPIALETTLSRARFEMQCPQADANVLSRTVTGFGCSGYTSYYSYYGNVSALYTIGVTGCGKQRTYIAECNDGSVGCFAALSQPWDEGYGLAQLIR